MYSFFSPLFRWHASLKRLFDPSTNYSTLRHLMSEPDGNSPVLPYIGLNSLLSNLSHLVGILLQDILSIDQIEDKHENGLLNIRKLRRLATYFESVRMRQKVSCTKSMVPFSLTCHSRVRSA